MPSSFNVEIQVPFRYEVAFTSGAFDLDHALFAEAISRREPGKRQRLFFVIDSGVAQAWPDLEDRIRTYINHHPNLLCLAGSPFVVPGGEQVKNDPRHVERVHEQIAQRGLDRQSFCVVIGGGAVQDMAGFAAATAHRGLRVVRFPTTVLSQNDSGVGVKNGINAFGVKNFVGSFAPPFAVINDERFLETLTHRDRIAGVSEAVKVSLIRDPAFFDWLEKNAPALARLDLEATRYMVQRSAELHLGHIASSGDPFELGSARPLDFGHWAAHKLESLTAHELRHGEAVAIGVALDTLVSVESGLLPAADARRVLGVFNRLGLATFHPALELRDADRNLKVLDGLREFREHLGGELTVTMLEGPGKPVDCHEVSPVHIARAIRLLKDESAATSPTAAVSGAAE